MNFLKMLVASVDAILALIIMEATSRKIKKIDILLIETNKKIQSLKDMKNLSVDDLIKKK